MSETPFFKTAMGRDFFDRNMPMLVKQLTRLNDNIEALSAQLKETKIDYAKMAQAIMDSPVKIEHAVTMGVPLQEESDVEPR